MLHREWGVRTQGRDSGKRSRFGLRARGGSPHLEEGVKAQCRTGVEGFRGGEQLLGPRGGIHA